MEILFLILLISCFVFFGISKYKNEVWVSGGKPPVFMMLYLFSILLIVLFGFLMK